MIARTVFEFKVLDPIDNDQKSGMQVEVQVRR